MRRTVIALLALGLIQCAAYCWALCSEGAPGIGCFDQGCYAQAARRIVEGHAFSYAPGLPASSGQTSVLYPFVLAAPMALGAEGTAIRTVSLVLACLFYLVFLGSWGAVIVRYLDVGIGRVAAVALLGLSGICAYVAFTQCDQGMWMALSGMIAAALVYRRKKTVLALLCLAPWVRPEGMMLVVSFVVVRLVKERRWRSSILPGLSVIAVFGLNLLLTGEAQFASVAEKGYFRIYPFAVAVVETVKDALAICSTYLASVPIPLKRLFSSPSPVASLAFWVGIVALVRKLRSWDTASVVFALVAVMDIGSVASGGFSGIDFDRYLAWIIPPVFLVSAYGIGRCTAWIRSDFWRKLPISALIVTTLFSTVSMVLMMRDVSVSRLEFFRELHEEAKLLPEGALVGSDDFVWAYELPPAVRYREISGVFTPALLRRSGRHMASWRELLKYDLSARFDYWVTGPLIAYRDTPRQHASARVMYGEPLVRGEGRRYLRRADWSAYDRAAESPLAPLAPSARLDIGYYPDELSAEIRCHGFSVVDHCRFSMVAARAKDGQSMIDAGALVSRAQCFTLSTKPSVPARLVIRTTGTVWVLTDKSYDQIDYGDELRLAVFACGREVGAYVIPVKADVFDDYVIEIPGECFTSSRTEFRIEGSFPVFGYWLYQ